MERSDTQLPHILLVDNDPGRIGYLENLLYHHGYQTVTVAIDDLAKGVEGQPKLVLSYLPFQPGTIVALGIPVLVMVPKSTCARLKDIARALWSNSNAEEDLAGKGNSPEALAGSWSDFEQWIRSTIGSDFIWKARPSDTPENRRMTADSIVESMKKNDGSFPKRNAFVERQEG